MTDNDTMKTVIDELNNQHQLDNQRLAREREINSKLSAEINALQNQISSIKSSHHVDYQKMKLLISNLECDLTKETEMLKQEKNKTAILKHDLESERATIGRLRDDINKLTFRIKEEKKKFMDEEKQRKFFEESLQEHKLILENCQKRLTEASHNKNDNIMLSEKLNDLESELSQLKKQVGLSYTNLLSPSPNLLTSTYTPLTKVIK